MQKEGARKQRALTIAPNRLVYPGTDIVIELLDVPEVERALGQAIKGWIPARSFQPKPDGRVARVAALNDGFATHSSYLDTSLSGLGIAGAACAVIADIAQDFFETRPGCLALHCGAFRYNGQLIAITGASRAGKSTLIARLTAERDMEVFCDDVLPVLADGLAFGLGIAPRLRLPLPAKSSASFRAHIAETLGPCDSKYGYVCAPNVAPHGTRAPLAVLLLLDRQPDAPAALHEVAEDEALQFLLSQNMSDLANADDALRRMTALVAQLTCLRLIYADLEEAVTLIRRAFGAEKPVARAFPLAPALPWAPRQHLPATDLDPSICWERVSDVMLQEHAQSAFLWQAGKPFIWTLNTLALAVWTMLEMPGSAAEIAAVLSEEYPDHPSERILSDVNALLQALFDAGMIAPVSEHLG